MPLGQPKNQTRLRSEDLVTNPALTRCTGATRLPRPSLLWHVIRNATASINRAIADPCPSDSLTSKQKLKPRRSNPCCSPVLDHRHPFSNGATRRTELHTDHTSRNQHHVADRIRQHPSSRQTKPTSHAYDRTLRANARIRVIRRPTSMVSHVDMDLVHILHRKRNHRNAARDLGHNQMVGAVQRPSMLRIDRPPVCL